MLPLSRCNAKALVATVSQSAGVNENCGGSRRPEDREGKRRETRLIPRHRLDGGAKDQLRDGPGRGLRRGSLAPAGSAFRSGGSGSKATAGIATRAVTTNWRMKPPALSVCYRRYRRLNAQSDWRHPRQLRLPLWELKLAGISSFKGGGGVYGGKPRRNR